MWEGPMELQGVGLLVQREAGNAKEIDKQVCRK